MEQSCYKTYVKQISKYPLLTAEQEHELSRKIQDGDEVARQTLIKANLRLVVSIAIKGCRNADSLMDIIQEGNLGMMIAVSKYQASFNTRFSTYAYAWIVQYINRYTNLKTAAILIPALKAERLHAINMNANELALKLNRIPSDKEIAIYIGIDEDIVREARSYDYTIISIDSPMDSESGKTFVEFLPDEKMNLEAEVIQHFERKNYVNIIKTLPHQECFVMLNRYRSFTTGEKTSLQSIGRKLGVSVEATRQIEIRACLKLRSVLKSHVVQFA